MKKFWLGGFVILAAVGGVLFAQDDDPDIFGDQPFSMAVVPFHARPSSVAQTITSFSSDNFGNPQTVFHPGDFVGVTSEFFVVPKGAGIQTETITVDASTPHRTRHFSNTATICNTSDTSTCDDIPDETQWAIVMYLKNPIPKFFNFILNFTGPIPFNSVVTGTGYEAFSATVTGSSVAAQPK